MKRITPLLAVLQLLVCINVYADITHETTVACGEEVIQLKTTTTGDSYKWSTGANAQSIQFTPTADATYWCEVTKKGGSTDTDNLISAGSFEFYPTNKVTSQQNKMGQLISYEYANFNTSGKNIGFGATTTATDANNVKTAYFAHCTPHDGSWLLVCDGGASSGTKIWSARNLKLEKGKTYEFRCYASNIDLEYAKHGQNTLAKIQFRIESEEGDKNITGWEYVGKLEGGDLGKWKCISGTYTPAKDLGWAHISIYNACTEAAGNDFAIDDIYFGYKSSSADVVTKEIFPVKKYAKPTVSLDGPKVDCPSTDVTLNTTIQGSKTDIEWYKGSQLISGETGAVLTVKTPASVGVTDTYKVLVYNNKSCPAAEATAQVSANPVEDENVFDTVERGKAYSKNGFNISASETASKSQIKQTRDKGCSKVYLTLNTYSLSEMRACYGSTITLSAVTEGVSYTWYYNNAIVGLQKDLSLSANGGVYKCVVKQADDTESTDEIKLVTDAHPGKGQNTYYEECAGDGPYTISVAPGITPADYASKPEYYPWNPSYSLSLNGVDKGSLVQPVINDVYFPDKIGATDVYKVVLKNGMCEETSVFNLKAKECSPQPKEHKSELCQSEGGVMVLKPETTGLSYTWSNGSTESLITVSTAVAGTFTYKCVIKTSTIEGTDQEEDFIVIVNPNPEISITARNQTATVEVSSGTAPYTYKVDGSQEYTSPVIKDLPEGLHSFLVTDAKGCTATGSVEIVIKPVVPIVPMVFFSPNGDGLNDLWLVQGLDSYPNALIQIFDRYSRLLFTYKASDFKGWDGTYNGHPMVRDDYWFVIMGEDIETPISGHFTLKR